MNLIDFFKGEKKTAIAECNVCGSCAKKCPIISRTQIADVKSPKIQQAVFDFLDTGRDSPVLRERIQSCMKCYGCVDICPQGLNPLRNLEISAWQMAEKGLLEFPEWDPLLFLYQTL